MKLMESTINLEARLLDLDKEIHALLNMVREQQATKKKTGMVRETLGAWGYDVDSKKFVDNLRKSKRLDWVNEDICRYFNIRGLPQVKPDCFF